MGHFQSVACQLALSSSPWVPVGEFRGLLGMLKGEAQGPPERGLPVYLGVGQSGGGEVQTQGWNPGLLHCRWILYQLSHKESP